MLAKVLSGAINGLDASVVDVEVDISNGMPAFNIVGLPDAAVQEAKERVRSAIRNSGATFLAKRYTINLAPADSRKEGPSYDLPIAVALLAASGQIDLDAVDRIYVGELSLDGAVRHTNGVLPLAALARERGIKEIVVPAINSREASLIPDIAVIPVESLSQLIAHFRGDLEIAPHPPEDLDAVAIEALDGIVDFSEIKGQEHVKRALEIAAAGSHNVLMSGPPGSGKTLLARAIPGLLPRLDLVEALEVTKMASVAGLVRPEQPLIRRRPYRSPHHTISYAGLVGGGRTPKPGEISLAGRGVLFLDELPEFPPKALEALRQPLEDKVITISRAQSTVVYPASFMMIGAMNPCP